MRKIGGFSYTQWEVRYYKLIEEFKIKYVEKIKKGMNKGDQIQIQEDLFKESFKGTNIIFEIEIK